MHRRTRPFRRSLQHFPPLLLAALALAGCDGGSTPAEPGRQPDTTPPQVALTAPVEGTVLGTTTVTLAGTATDDQRVSRVAVQRNGAPEQPVTFAQNAAGVSFTAQVTLDAGENTLVVHVYDLAGNRGSAPAVRVVADPEGPSVAVSTTDTVLTESRVRVQGTAADGQRVTRLTWAVNGGAEQEVPITAAATVVFDFEVALAARVNAIRVFAYDAAGHRAQTSADLRVTRDMNNPAAQILHPFAAATPAREVDVVYTASDDVGVRSVAVRVNGGPETVVPLSASGEGPPLRVALATGANHIEVRVHDVVGRTSVTQRTVTRTGPVSFASVVAGVAHRCALTPAGQAYCWGHNAYGQVGVGTLMTPDARVPYAVAGGRAFTALTAGMYSTCGLDAGGQVWCWGQNTGGTFGTGDLQDALVPRLAADGQRFARLDAGQDHTCALTSDGTPYCWGTNGHGALGNGASIDHVALAPERVSGGFRFVEISAGAGNGCGRTSAGEVYCWGWRSGGGPTVPAGPARIGGGETFRGVVAGIDGGCVLNDAGARCWGAAVAPLASQVPTTPVAVPGRGDFVAIAQEPGADRSCGLTAGGQGWCWGHGLNGGLGSGTRANSDTPVPVAGGHTFTSMAVGLNGGCGVVASGAVYCWGSAFTGDGGIDLHATPVRAADGR